MSTMKDRNLRLESLCAKENKTSKDAAPHVTPIFASSAFTFEDIEESIKVFKSEKEGYVYSRFGNPGFSAVEEKLAELECLGIEESAHALLTSSGMSAISTLLLTHLRPGDTLLTQDNLYGGTTELIRSVLAGQGVKIVSLQLTDPSAYRKLISDAVENHPEAKMMYFETPSNPTLICTDISELVKACQEAGLSTAIDNTFCTPYLQQPMKLGVDYVIYSTTKFLNGHGNAIGGAIICKSREQKSKLWHYLKLLGTNSNPFDAWLVHNGIKTLALRMDRHCHNALELASYLESHERVLKVNYPGLESHASHKIAKKQMNQYGAMLSFELDGNMLNAKKFMNACKLCTIASTLGNIDTLLLHPASSSHLNVSAEVRKSTGITDGLIRVSVGIEHIEDIIADVEQAIQKALA